MSGRAERVVIVGAGLAGNLLAIFLAKRGLRPLVIERRSERAMHDVSGGRSINLALASRGIAALAHVGLDEVIGPLLLPMRGRMIHELDAAERLSPYGQSANESIYSVSRAGLNLELYRIASAKYRVQYRFGCECRGIDAETLAPIIDGAGGATLLRADVTFGADGAGSAVRRSLLDRGELDAVESLLDHGYKELVLPPAPSGEFALDPQALHIWPRDDFMLIALPNTDRSFTATLFLPLEGPASFTALDKGGVRSFFSHQFPDASPLIPNLERQFKSHPTGILGTVRCHPWAHSVMRSSAKADVGRLLLLGDAAHAIVPFHGQGMNAAFEDIVELDRLMSVHGTDWRRVFEAFEAMRVPNANAIADMALENYREMRALVRDEKFQLQRRLELELERRFAPRFIPRYSMVMFHPEISYAEAQRRGALQRDLLERLTRDAATLADVDYERAAALLEQAPSIES